VVTLDGRSHPVDVRRHPAARRYTLRVASDDRLRLTVPRWASIAEGLRFVESQAEWIRRERARQAAARAPWGAGTRFWFRGELVTIDPVPGGVSFGLPPVVVPTSDADIRPSVQARLRALAEAELPPRLLELAAIRRLDVAAVHVRNQRSRWGACSSLRRITLNWRLIQMPPYVSDYVMLHELTHLEHPNHSRRFWRAVARVCPAWRDAEAWLRRWGRELL
jgi:predicted metal-dependent hydrolase